MKTFSEFLSERLERGGFSTEDVLASLLPLMRQVYDAHAAGMAAPLDGIDHLRVEGVALWFEDSARTAATTDRSRLHELDNPRRTGVEVVGEHRRAVEVGGGGSSVQDLLIGQPGEAISRPVYLPSYRCWEHAVGHHDPLSDVFSLGMILGSLSCGLDFRDPDSLRAFVANRHNLFAINPGLHPVLAKATRDMTELSRSRRPQDLRTLIRSLENYREQEVDFDLDLARIKGFGERDLRGKQQIVLGRLQERLFEISRRNRLLHFRDTAGTICLSDASVPLSFDPDTIRPDQILTWNGAFRTEISAGKRVSLNRSINFREALYVAPTLDRIRAEALRDQAEFGFQQLRLVLCFLRWADVKASPPERYFSPLVLLSVKLVKKKGVRDSYHLEPTSTVAEVNPVVRHMFKQLYDISLPETIDLAEATIDDLYTALKGKVESSEASITLRKVDRPRIELIHERARRRLDMYRRRVRVSGRGLRSFRDLDYSYDPVNFHPLGLRIFNAWIRPAETHLRTVLQERPRPRHYLAPTPGAEPGVKEKTFYALHRDDQWSPYEWELDLCKVTLGNFRYRKMTLVRDYDELLADPRTNPAFDATFSLKPRVVETETAAAPPLHERCDVVSCDPSQAAAIGFARSGVSYIIQGPPGTGKSQTITNLIADHVACGKRVLFVCEKRAAIDVVFSRLSQRGLQDLCCLIHDSQADKREFVMELKQTYESMVAAAANGHSRCARQRERLDGIIEELAEPLDSYVRTMLSSPENAGTTVQSLLHRAITLGSASPPLSPYELERVPFYERWLASREAVAAFIDKLPAVQPSLVLSQHPLRLLSSRLFEADRPFELVLEALDAAEPLLERLVAELTRVNLPEALLRDLDTVGEAAALAAEAEPLARLKLTRVLDPDSELGRSFAARIEAHQQARAALAEAQEATASWREKLPRREIGPALDAAVAFEGRFGSWLKPSWWRLRSALRARYDFSSHAVRPTWSRVLRDLEQEYLAADDAGRAEMAFAEAFGIREDLETILATAGALSARSQDPGFTGWLGAILPLAAPDDAVRALATLEPSIMELQEILDDVLQDHEDLGLTELLDQLMAIRESLDDLPDFLGCLSDLAAMHPELAAAFRRLPLTPAELETASLRRTLEAISRTERSLRSLSGAERDALSRKLLTAHHRWLELNGCLLREKVRTRFVDHLRVASLPAAQLTTEQSDFKKRYNSGRRELEHEFGKTMRFKPIRDLVAGESGMVIDDLKPIWLMSPLSVSDTLPLDCSRFDVVIFDEASQITLENAVPALFRAGQAIVVGDEMQLPPTNFFSAKTDDDASTLWLEEGEERVEYDLSLNSFLSHAAKNLPSRMLGWHYRSRSESLISFSNWAFYDGRLLTVPEEQLSTARRPEILVRDPADGDANAHEVLERAISFHRLEDGVYQHRRNRREAEYIAHLVRALLAQKSNPTIGIVAFSEAQQTEIEEALARLGDRDPSFRERMEAELTREEDGQFVGLLVKNLENIQGDERDIIILSVCYGHGPDGTMRMNFGPINQIGGEKRLNVAFSRAKDHMVLVSSIQYHDITNDYNDGASCLKRYLQYAAACSVADGETARRVQREMCPWRDDTDRRSASRSSVVADRIAEALERHGFTVDRNVGMSEFRCDLALRGDGDASYRLGILLDDGAYYRNGDLLEREVFRPRLLTVFGWRIARVLCREWYEDPDGVLQGLLAIARGERAAREIAPDRAFADALDARLEEAEADAAAALPDEAPPGATPAPSSVPATATGILDLQQNTPRYFEFVGGTSRKFWEITLSGNRFSVRFGRIGTPGQERVKSFSSDEAAALMARRLLSEKLGKGYEEKPRPKPPSPNPT